MGSREITSQRSDVAAWKAIRRTAFRTRFELDTELTSVVAAEPSHRFLANPTCQITYLYLVHYVLRLAEFHFGRGSDRIRFLDWGCGKGHVSYLLRKAGARVESCDIAEAKDDSTFGQATPLIRRFDLPVTPLGHPVELPYGDGSHDVVLSFGVLEHVADDAGSLGEIARVLSPGGLFFCFNLPYVFSWTQRLSWALGDRYHDRLYSRKATRELVLAAGLEVQDLWHRQVLPKNDIHYPFAYWVERVDQALTESSPFRYLATSLEFVASKCAHPRGGDD